VGTVTPRRRSDGSTGYTAQIRIKRKGKIVYTEAQTFDRRAAAAAWLTKREGELAQPGALECAQAKDPRLSDVIDQYAKEMERHIGHTKEQCLRTIKMDDIAGLDCSQVNSVAISALAKRLLATGIDPSTVGNYLSHLSAIMAVARPLWGYPLDPKHMEDAQVALRKTGVIAKSKKRSRRPTLDELDRLMIQFGTKGWRRKHANPMRAIIAFAIFSTRRQEEICRITWDDLDETHSRVLVRDMKHPDEKDGNDQWVDLVPEALQIIQAQPRKDARIFPCSVDAVSAAFTRAVAFLEIADLRFHDLRHEGISRLFEMGRTIPQVACVSGHRSWGSLQRYSHLRQSGDKYAGWPWLAIVTIKK
jgi:integrase